MKIYKDKIAFRFQLGEVDINALKNTRVYFRIYVDENSRLVIRTGANKANNIEDTTYSEDILDNISADVTRCNWRVQS